MGHCQHFAICQGLTFCVSLSGCGDYIMLDWISLILISSDNLSDDKWFPKQKVEFARRKLQGHNPAAITRYI